MSIFEDEIKLSERLRYQYFDKDGFTKISDNTRLVEYIERYDSIGYLTELAFLHTYLDYNYETDMGLNHKSTASDLINLIKTKKADSHIDWIALYDYLDKLKQTRWRKIIDNDINDALEVFEPFRGELAGVKNNQSLWI